MNTIDAVILWVDGSDPAWQAEKAKYLPPSAKDSASVNRYRDWGLLPYWFRAIEKFTPWFRKIHFVTWGHLPEFLNLDAPKLHVVKHSDFIPEEYLPTFNSHAIEMNIHRIPDLAEQFVYFNDDMFVLRSMQETDFFRDGLPCSYGCETPWVFRGEIGVWAHAAANNMGVVNAHFDKREAVRHHGKKYLAQQYRWQDNIKTFILQRLFPECFTGFKNLHAPASYLKESFKEVWDAEPELLNNTCLDKFRTAANVNQWVCLWWQLASGKFAPSCIESRMFWLWDNDLKNIRQTIENQTVNMICLNDPDIEVDPLHLIAQLQEAFEKILPCKSSFEKL
ncbi:MAG: Stealth CR1 domain-containing protein [Clostridia bacterium]|nr:Stealth CR1 domain-containing protein [Clostridia bacterium]